MNDEVKETTNGYMAKYGMKFELLFRQILRRTQMEHDGDSLIIFQQQLTSAAQTLAEVIDKSEIVKTFDAESYVNMH